jgi:pimeloyl-ACP methyl ester carboxylesterase
MRCTAVRMTTRTMSDSPPLHAARSAPLLPPAIDAEQGDVDIMGEGRVHYYADRRVKGRPVVLVHSINAAASSYEMRPLFEALRGTRRVFALDLPGFGRSARDVHTYTPEFFARAIERFVVDVASPQGAPCDVVALSLSCEFVARAALAERELFHALTLISPTGLSTRKTPRALEALRARAVAPLLHVGPVGRGVFKLLATRPSIRFFLSRSFAGPVDEGLAAYAQLTANVPGAERAPLAFVSGELFTPDAADALYAPLRVPTLVLYDHDAYTDFGALDAVSARNPEFRGQRVAPSKGMPQFEHTAAVAAAVNRDYEAANGA